MATYTGFHHLALATGDTDRTIRFWRDLVGLTLAAGLGKPGGRSTSSSWPRATCGASSSSGREWSPCPRRTTATPPRGPYGFDHLAIGVASETDLWELRDRLEAAGFWVSKPIDHTLHPLHLRLRP